MGWKFVNLLQLKGYMQRSYGSTMPFCRKK